MNSIALLCSLAFFTAVTVSAQPTDYYVPAQGLADGALRTALHEIIGGHTTYPYSSGSATDTWEMLTEADRDPENPDNVILVYSGFSVNGPQQFNEGNGWNREHVWPRSRGSFSTAAGIGTDMHNLKPCNIEVNNIRGNRFFADCQNCTPVFTDGVNTECFLDNSNGTFEPRDAVKGDVARMILYMAVRYEGGGEPNMELTEEILPEGDNAPLMGRLSDMLAWHFADPPDDFELNRHEVIFGYQGNRNPFIDHPELADHLWGSLQGETWPVNLHTTAPRSEKPKPRAYPNPAVTEVFLPEEAADAVMRSVTGSVVLRATQTTRISLESLPAGVYLLEWHSPESGREVQRLIKL